MNHLDLFSGIGGFSLAAQRVWDKKHNVVAFVEQDKYCQKVLKKHWPNVPIINDIRNFDGKKYAGTIDLLTGGFPCQPFSVAGKQRGKKDDRYLWPEMFRIIQETKPTWIIGENVPGIINMGLETTVVDLEAKGYEVELLVLPACSVGAWHQRYRVWIMANSEQHGWRGKPQNIFKGNRDMGNCRCINSLLYGSGSVFEGETAKTNRTLDIKSSICRKDDGISSRVDRLKGLGNAIVPQVAEQIMKGIKPLIE